MKPKAVNFFKRLQNIYYDFLRLNILFSQQEIALTRKKWKKRSNYFFLNYNSK